MNDIEKIKAKKALDDIMGALNYRIIYTEAMLHQMYNSMNSLQNQYYRLCDNEPYTQLELDLKPKIDANIINIFDKRISRV